jgi:hypothetical protein
MWVNCKQTNSSACPLCRQEISHLVMQTITNLIDESENKINVISSIEDFLKLPGVRQINGERSIILNIQNSLWISQFKNLIVLHKLNANTHYHNINKSILQICGVCVYFSMCNIKFAFEVSGNIFSCDVLCVQNGIVFLLIKSQYIDSGC